MHEVINIDTIAHGGLTGANTIININNDPILNKNASETTGNQKASQAPETALPESAPTGKLEIEPGRTLSPAEQKIADKLVGDGKTVKVPKEVENQAGVRNPDFEIDELKTELKTVSNITKTDSNGLSAKLSQRIGEAGNQASHVILDVSDQAGMTKEIAERSTNRAFGKQRQLGGNKIQEVRIIRQDFDILVPYIP